MALPADPTEPTVEPTSERDPRPDGEPAELGGDAPLTLPVLPLAAGVVLPQMVVTIALETDEARAAAEAIGDDRRVLLVPNPEGRYATVGVIAHVEDDGALPNGTPALVVRAERRARLGTGVVGSGAALWLRADPIDEPEPSERARELATEYKAAARSLLQHLGGRRLAGLLRDLDDPSALADSAGWWPDLSVERKVELLETVDVEERLTRVIAWTKEALAEAELSEKIRTEVTEGMERQQREFLLRQQLQAIRKELGETGDEADEAQAYRDAIADRDLPEAVRTAVEREIDRLERTSPQNTEHGWIRAWLDTVTEIPWGVRTDDDLDLDHARTVLDEDHTGLDEVKERIVEELAVRKLRAERDAARAADGDDGVDDARPPARPVPTIVVLAGPPGVGKTSLGASVARALGRRFVRVALGGVRDEAEIRGHRRTYVGAREGRIAKALIEAGTMNPVLLLDEIDKVGNDWRGDPSAALLEVLDPAQNHTFRDHFLEVDLDLSDVLFLATANVLDTIPGPLLDRMEVIRIDGYTEAEKVAIARDHLLPRLRERMGLRDDEVVVTDEALAALASEHTREAGVRNLERLLGKVLRRSATAVADRHDGRSHDEDGDADDADAGGPVVIGPDELPKAAGRPRFRHDEANREAAVGVVNGLAVTGAGGDVLVVEATAMDGDGPEAGRLVLTGQLGDVMTESGQIALSHIRANRERLGIDGAAFARRFHVHFPAGAVPKDGPSAGVTMTTALVSLLTGRAVKPTVGMTGEVTLQGKVLPIGGVKQKLLAAHRAGLTDVVIPAANEPDLEDLPEGVLDELRVHPVAHVDEVLAIALEADAGAIDAAAA
ncbi:MAG: endopeptidase La [Acidimicrobiales bacterium]